jgi:magnesium chelatase family protein
MSLALVRARALDGLDAPEVTVEVHLANGLPAFNLVGLPDTEVREARDRVRAAILTSQFEFPQRRITVNLAPAELPK